MGFTLLVPPHAAQAPWVSCGLRLSLLGLSGDGGTARSLGLLCSWYCSRRQKGSAAPRGLAAGWGKAVGSKRGAVDPSSRDRTLLLHLWLCKGDGELVPRSPGSPSACRNKPFRAERDPGSAAPSAGWLRAVHGSAVPGGGTQNECQAPPGSRSYCGIFRRRRKLFKCDLLPVIRHLRPRVSAPCDQR